MLGAKYCAPGPSALLPLLLEPDGDFPLLSLETAASQPPQGARPPAQKPWVAALAHPASPLRLGPRLRSRLRVPPLPSGDAKLQVRSGPGAWLEPVRVFSSHHCAHFAHPQAPTS